MNAAKLVDAKPTWAEFRGWSVLLEQANARIGWPDSAAGGVAASTLERAAERLRSSVPGFAALPSTTHHITLCDGVNESNRGRLDDTNSWYTAVLRADGVRTAVSLLCETARFPIEWTGTKLEARGHAVVLPMEPDRQMNEVVERRSAVQREINRYLDIDLTSEWRPHITIGYVLDRSVWTSHRSHLDDEIQPIFHRTAGAAVYRFTDMETFVRFPVVGSADG